MRLQRVPSVPRYCVTHNTWNVSEIAPLQCTVPPYPSTHQSRETKTCLLDSCWTPWGADHWSLTLFEDAQMCTFSPFFPPCWFLLTFNIAVVIEGVERFALAVKLKLKTKLQNNIGTESNEGCTDKFMAICYFRKSLKLRTLHTSKGTSSVVISLCEGQGFRSTNSEQIEPLVWNHGGTGGLYRIH